MSKTTPLPPPPPPMAQSGKPKSIASLWGEVRKSGRRIGIYGESGAGKTSLAATVQGETVFLDLENTLYALFGKDIPENIHAAYPDTWQQILDILNADFTTVQNIVIDSITTAEVMLDQYVLRHFRANKAGFGKVDFFEEEQPALHTLNELGGGGADNAKYQAFNSMLMQLERLSAKGINIITIAHDCAKEMEDLTNGGAFRRNEPRLNDPNSGKNSMRRRYIEWLDDLFFVYFERVSGGEDHREHRTGDRLVAVEAGDGYMAKSRTFSGDPIKREEFDLSSVIK